MKIKNIIIIIIIVLIIAVGVFSFISMNSHETKLEVLSNSTLKNGDVITVVLKDDYRNVYPNETINVKLLDESGWATIFEATTDSNGEATVDLLALDNGNYTVHSTVNGTMFLKPSKSITNLEIDDGL